MQVSDVGCGPGSIIADLAARIPSRAVIGIDMSDDVLQKARVEASQRGISNIKFKAENVEGLRYPHDTFDVAHTHQVLQHVGDPVQALRELMRVVKSGGIVACRDADWSHDVVFRRPRPFGLHCSLSESCETYWR